MHFPLIKSRIFRAAACIVLALALLPAGSQAAPGTTIGSVDTAFKLIGPNHKIVVDAFDDPMISGVTCFVSHAQTGGWKGAIGIAEDTSDASIACRQVGDTLTFTAKLPDNAEIFNERSSVLFKRLRVVRMVDWKRNALVYVTYSDKLIDGSPKNSISAVAVPASNRIPKQ